MARCSAFRGIGNVVPAKIFAAIASLALGLSAHAGWTVESTQSDFSLDRRVEHRSIVLRSEIGDQAKLELALFSSKTATLRVIDNPAGDHSLGEAMAREDCLAGVNGGYFDPDFAPIGLTIRDGRVAVPQQKARLLSGIVSATRDRVVIRRAAEFSLKEKPTGARQCGPLLVDRGKVVAGLNNTRSARRTFVATLPDGMAALGYCSSVTLAELGALLAAPSLKVERALNLDGGSSSAFWFTGAKGVFSIAEGKPVRDFIAIAAKE